MTAYQTIKLIRKLILNSWGEVIQYKNIWSNEFKLEHIDILTYDKDRVKNLLNVNIYELTVDQLLDLGFGKWNDESNLYLIPIWLVPFLDKNLQVTSISGNISTLGEVDKDTRFGCIAWGIKL